MKYSLLISLALSLALLSCQSLHRQLDKVMDVSGEQLKSLSELYHDSEQFPRSWDPATGKYKDFSYRDWTGGFFPGSLWIYYEMTGKEEYRTMAEHYTAKLAPTPFYTHTHDLGFMVMCSYGRQFDNIGDDTSRAAIIQAATSLIGRFDPQIGLIRSWSFGKWNYPVIIDNMMNLELLFRASELTGDDRFRNIAISHADGTIKNHFREDASTWHVVSYNADGSIESKGTHQGYSDDSRWARGQAWAIYGYTMCYRFTKEARYLEQACKVASLIMTLPDMPEDHIPYWDYDAPGKPDAVRDASAAAITASALLELKDYVDPELSASYLEYAESIMSSLSSKQYLAGPGENGYFILKHSTGAAPLNSEVDVAINYADYYFLEAIERYYKDKGFTAK